ncbi:MAG: hypothetical protein V4440_14580 [Pseudomonadota bacterium]
MTITVTITKPQVYDSYGILLASGSSYGLQDDFARALVSQGKATDTNNVMSNAQPFEFGGIFDALGNIVGVKSPQGIAASDCASLTWANRPVLSSVVRGNFYATDVGNGNYFTWNGIRYKPLNGSVLLDSIDTANAGIANTAEQQLNPNHNLMPAGLLQGFDRFRIYLAASKSGTVDTCTLRVRFGPLGTVADPVIATITALATTNQTYGTIMEFKRATATTVQKQGAGDPNVNYGGASATAYPAAVTVSNMDTTAMYLSLTAQMTAGTEATTLQDYTLELYSTDS